MTPAPSQPANELTSMQSLISTNDNATNPPQGGSLTPRHPRKPTARPVTPAGATPSRREARTPPIRARTPRSGRRNGPNPRPTARPVRPPRASPHGGAVTRTEQEATMSISARDHILHVAGL